MRCPSGRPERLANTKSPGVERSEASLCCTRMGCERPGELNGAPRLVGLERLPATVAVDLELKADRRSRHVVQFEVA